MHRFFLRQHGAASLQQYSDKVSLQQRKVLSGVAPQPDRFVSKHPPCEHCGGQLHLIAITDGSGRVLVSRDVPRPALASHATNYLDSG